MHRLGYSRYGTQGGDTGSVVSPEVGRIAPEHVIGVHVNGGLGSPSGDPEELEGLSSAEQERLAQEEAKAFDGAGYAMIQSTRPQTLGVGLSDSPAGSARLDHREVPGVDRPCARAARGRRLPGTSC